MTRIAVGGFLHETNTFAPTKATYDAFVHGGGWPSMALGTDVLKVMRKINVGLAGFVDAADDNGWELVPTISCAASPSAHVTKDAFERVVKVMVDGIASPRPCLGRACVQASASGRTAPLSLPQLEIPDSNRHAPDRPHRRFRRRTHRHSP
jgi:hypothetical protein